MHEGLKVDFDFGKEWLIVCSKDDVLIGQQSGRHAPEIPFSTNVGAWSEHHFHPMFVGEMEKPNQVLVSSGVVELTLPDLVVVPHDVDTQGIHAHSLDHQDSVFPVLIWDSRIMHFSRIDLRW